MSDNPASWARHDEGNTNGALEGSGWSNPDGRAGIAEEDYLGSNDNAADNQRESLRTPYKNKQTVYAVYCPYVLIGDSCWNLW